LVPTAATGWPIDDFGVQATVNGVATVQPMPLTAMGGPAVTPGADSLVSLHTASVSVLPGTGYAAQKSAPIAIPAADITRAGSGVHEIVWKLGDTQQNNGGPITDTAQSEVRMDWNPAGEVVAPGAQPAGTELMCNFFGDGKRPTYVLDGNWYTTAPHSGLTDPGPTTGTPTFAFGGSGVKWTCGDWEHIGRDEPGYIFRGGSQGTANEFVFGRFTSTPALDASTDLLKPLSVATLSQINYGSWSATSLSSKDTPLVGHWTPPTGSTPAPDTQAVRRDGTVWHLATSLASSRGTIGFTDKADPAVGQPVIGDFNGDGISDEADVVNGQWTVITGPHQPNGDNQNAALVTAPLASFDWNPAPPPGPGPFRYQWLTGGD
jgi:hypothetical protein